jgi:hypothetical protein
MKHSEKKEIAIAIAIFKLDTLAQNVLDTKMPLPKGMKDNLCVLGQQLRSQDQWRSARVRDKQILEDLKKGQLAQVNGRRVSEETLNKVWAAWSKDPAPEWIRRNPIFIKEVV